MLSGRPTKPTTNSSLPEIEPSRDRRWQAVIGQCAALLTAGAMTACANLPLLSGSAPEHAPLVRHRFALPPPGDDIVGEIQVVVARADDTLLDIARHFDVGYNEITAANPGVDPWLPGAGTRVVVPTQFILPPEPWEGIVINVTAMRLYYFPKAFPGEHPVVVTHPIGVGRIDWPTPTGHTSIVEKTVKPSWYVPASIRREHAEAGDPLPAVVPPGPDNPLGDFAMRLSMREYLIHGTNKPYGIGMRVSHGCIRMYPEDIESLFAGVPIGTPVRLVKTPYAVGRRDGALYVAAHAPLAEDLLAGEDGAKDAMAAMLRTAERAKITVDRAKAMHVIAAANGYPVPISPGTAPAAKVIADARRVQNPFLAADEKTAASGWSLLPFLRAVD